MVSPPNPPAAATPHTARPAGARTEVLTMAKHITHLHLTPLVLDNTQPDLGAIVADLAGSAAEALADSAQLPDALARLGLDEGTVQELHEAAGADGTDRAQVAARVAICLGLTLAEAPRGNLSWMRAAMGLAYPGYDVTFSLASLPSG
jgi:hypothetical protein